MPVINSSKRRWIVSRVKKADHFLSRILGWIGKAKVDPETALWVKPCWGIHTYGMNFPVDVVFLAKNSNVLSVVPNLPKNRVSPFVFSARSVLVLPAHSIERSKINIGDKIEIS